MCLLVESIKVNNGNLQNIVFHNERMNRALYEVFGIKSEVDLGKFIIVPEIANTGIYKCRVEYSHEIRKVEFLEYRVRPVHSLKIIEDDEIEYPHKFADRNRIEELGRKREECDDIIIVKNNFVTDSSYSNIVFRDLNGDWVTPSTYLLPGTRRSNLLRKGLISEKPITKNDIHNFSEVKLINAMLALDDTEGIPVCNIV